MDKQTTLGRYMRLLRVDAGMSLMEVSNRSGLGYTHLSRVENDSTVPNPTTIVKIAEVLDGDLMVMLRLADNLPRVILDRLSQRAERTSATTMHRSMPAGSESGDGRAAASLDELVREAALSQEEFLEMSEAVEGLLRLPANRRRLLVDLISSYFSEGDDPTG